MSKLNLWSLVCCMIAVFIFYVGYNKSELRKNTLQSKNLINVVIDKLSCAGNKSYMVFKHNGGNHIINMSGLVCNGLETGQEIDIFYSAKDDWYLMENDGLENNDSLAQIGGIILLILTIVNYVYNKKKERTRGV